jgi:hypothetical protein
LVALSCPDFLDSCCTVVWMMLLSFYANLLAFMVKINHLEDFYFGCNMYELNGPITDPCYNYQILAVIPICVCVCLCVCVCIYILNEACIRILQGNNEFENCFMKYILLYMCRFLVLISALTYKHWRNYNWI